MDPNETVQDGGMRNGTKICSGPAAVQKRPFSRPAGGKGVRHPAGGVPVGDRRDCPQCGDPKTAIQGVRCVH